MFVNGKPFERAGRKATGLSPNKDMAAGLPSRCSIKVEVAFCAVKTLEVLP